eukprot:2922355-Prorocentrum_lima.AAC.1
MTSSLVGSEMCIRDSLMLVQVGRGSWLVVVGVNRGGRRGGAVWGFRSCAVSYTHLTLPTICSV